MKSKELAKLIGPTLIVLSISEYTNLPIWKSPDPTLVYLNGIIMFVSGLSIIRVHNRWLFKWPLMITLCGWVAIAGGLFRVFFPEAKQAGQSYIAYTILAILFLAGLFLSFKACLGKSPYLEFD